MYKKASSGWLKHFDFIHYIRFDFILGMLSMLTVLQSKFCHKKWIGPVFCLLVAAVDETIQLFVSGRSGQVSDVVLDFVGALCGIALLLIIMKVFGKEGSRF